MKFRMVVTDERGEPWNEDENRSDVRDLEEALAWAERIIARYNATLRPNELPRTLISVDPIEDAEQRVDMPHRWRKTNLTTIMNKYFGSYDAMKCEECGITGKRPGLGNSGIIRDPAFRAKGYETCDGAKKLLERRKKREQ